MKTRITAKKMLFLFLAACCLIYSRYLSFQGKGEAHYGFFTFLAVVLLILASTVVDGDRLPNVEMPITASGKHPLKTRITLKKLLYLILASLFLFFALFIAIYDGGIGWKRLPAIIMLCMIAVFFIKVASRAANNTSSQEVTVESPKIP